MERSIRPRRRLLAALAVAALLASACAPAASTPAATTAPPNPTSAPAATAGSASGGANGGANAPAAKPTAAAAAQPTAAAKPTTAAELAVYQGADREQILEAGAKQEGTLSWYTSLAGDVIDKLTAGFKQKYPFIQQVDVFRGDEGQLLTRATQEAQAGQQVFDVLESQYTPIRILLDAKILTAYYSPSTASIPDGYKTAGPNGTVTDATVRISYVGFGYNTNAVPAADAPKTRDDLMNPALTGKISLAGSTTGDRWVGSVLHALGDEKGKQWLSDFAAKQKPTVQQVSGKALLDLIAKGEAVASPTIFEDHVLAAIASQNAPVKWVPIEPVVANVGSGALAAKAPHPHAALLFLDYLLGPDGQKILKATGYSSPSDQVSFQWWIPEQGRSADQVEQDAKSWNALFKATFRS